MWTINYFHPPTFNQDNGMMPSCIVRETILVSIIEEYENWVRFKISLSIAIIIVLLCFRSWSYYSERGAKEGDLLWLPCLLMSLCTWTLFFWVWILFSPLHVFNNIWKLHGQFNSSHQNEPPMWFHNVSSNIYLPEVVIDSLYPASLF